MRDTCKYDIRSAGYCFLWIAFIPLVTSCKKSAPMLYKGGSGVYIEKGMLPEEERDSMTYSFALQMDDKVIDTIYLPMYIAGNIASVDRPIPLEADPAKSTAKAAVHYELLPGAIKANAFVANFPVVVKRTPDLKEQEVRLYLHMGANQYFSMDLKYIYDVNNYDYSPDYVIRINDILKKPYGWEGDDSYMASFFGSYSAAKYKFIIKATGKPNWPDSSPGKDIMYGYYIQVYDALQAYEKLHGAMYDENGEKVQLPQR
ncbi:MAG TPA: DUF4843 domain-containing protein [Chitinophaga sp.]|uniref:DUF4843 domain-containing protein n=1 Tax=Chitinophaga sp. TaxID=1869181 RepID=UPI002B77E119|nr:DUF4843 domain-containing protein [Chitinophaga sp.]HVI48452.1 DUF4843 domain-containing protein [Chitinophaga sp.]